MKPKDAMSGQEIKPYPPDALTALTTPVARLSVIACKLAVKTGAARGSCCRGISRIWSIIDLSRFNHNQEVGRESSNEIPSTLDLVWFFPWFPCFGPPFLSVSVVNPKWISQLPARVGAYVRSGHMA